MKQLLALTGILLLTLGIPSCYNEETNFPDYDYTTTYFPYQYPVRTLVLGDYNFDNTNDNALRFIISAHMGGVYENTENISVQFQVDETLTENLWTTTGIEILPLPDAMYELSSTSSMTIPSGSFYGGVTVQLANSFLDDTLATGIKYVIPLKIINSTTDSVLLGKPAISDPDPRVASDWVTRPKNFTLFGIRFVNQFHGKYLLRGTDAIDTLGGPLETIVYRNKYVEQCEVVSVLTSGKDEVTYSNSVRLSTGSPGKFTMVIPFDASGNAVIHEKPGSTFPITGNAKFVKDADEWGGETRHVIYLNYVINDTININTHTVKDTLVFRDKAVTFAEFTPTIVEP